MFRRGSLLVAVAVALSVVTARADTKPESVDTDFVQKRAKAYFEKFPNEAKKVTDAGVNPDPKNLSVTEPKTVAWQYTASGANVDAAKVEELLKGILREVLGQDFDGTGTNLTQDSLAKMTLVVRPAKAASPTVKKPEDVDTAYVQARAKAYFAKYPADAKKVTDAGVNPDPKDLSVPKTKTVVWQYTTRGRVDEAEAKKLLDGILREILSQDFDGTGTNLTQDSLTKMTLVVRPAKENSPPSISPVADQTIPAGSASVGPLSFAVGDDRTAADRLTVTAVSNNQALVPDANIVLGGTGAARTVTVTAIEGQTGEAVVKLTVADEDGQSTSVSFRVGRAGGAPPADPMPLAGPAVTSWWPTVGWCGQAAWGCGTSWVWSGGCDCGGRWRGGRGISAGCSAVSAGYPGTVTAGCGGCVAVGVVSGPAWPAAVAVRPAAPAVTREQLLARADRPAPAVLYDEGFNAYWARNPDQAYEYLTAAAEAGSDDPRVWTYIALAELARGNSSGAATASAYASALEQTGGDSRSVAVALERVQGSLRAELDRMRSLVADESSVRRALAAKPTFRRQQPAGGVASK